MADAMRMAGEGRALTLVALLALATPAHAAQAPPAVAICATIEAAAGAHGLPTPFFTRLIWRESRFHAGALSPAGAQGVAQFMPATAAERGLADPFAAPAALQHSASFLQDLRATFGNLGLAAAAYNAGSGRVTRWLAGEADLPQETLDYVLAITGHEAAAWRVKPAPALRADEHFDCARYAAIAAREPEVHGSSDVAPSQPPKPWAVILVGSPARDKALSEYAQVRTRFSAILGGVPTRVVRKRVSGLVVPRFIVQIERGTRTEADALCGRLQRAGGACFVLANRG